MAKIEFKGLEEYGKKLEDLGRSSTGLIKHAVYVGADVVADKVRDQINALPEISYTEAMQKYRNGESYSGITDRQKQGLLDGMGLSSMRNDNGYINTRLGFVGYNSVKTKAHPNGQPNAMIARAVESGSSYRQKHPFVRPAVNAVKTKAENEMARDIDAGIEKLMK